MKKLLALAASLLLMLLLAAGSADHQAEEPSTATGVVFHDANGNRKHDPGEKLLQNVRVSESDASVRSTAGHASDQCADDRFARPDLSWKSSDPRQRLTTGACMRVLLAFSPPLATTLVPKKD